MKTTLETLRKHARPGRSVDVGYDTDARGNRTPIFYASPNTFSAEKFAHEVCSLGRDRHTGWYTNNDGGSSRDGWGLCSGVVLSFDPRPGFPNGWYVAGYNMNGDMCTYFPDVYDSAEDAARAADGHAEKIAEEERDYQYRAAQARQVQDDNEQAIVRLRECLALRHRACMDYVRDEARELMKTIRLQRERLSGELAQYL